MAESSALTVRFNAAPRHQFTCGLGWLVPLEVVHVALLFLLLQPLAEGFGLLLGGELGTYLRLDLAEGAGLLGLLVRNLKEVVAELGLDGADDLALLGAEGRLLEGRNGLALAQAAEVAALRRAAGVLGVLLGELREITAVFELLLHVLGLLFLVLGEEDMADADLLGGGELGLFVLLVVLLDLLVRRLRVVRYLLLHLLDREVLADVLAQLLFGDVVLLEGLLVGLLVAQILSRRAGLVADLFLDLLDLLVHLLVRGGNVVLARVSLRYLDADELGHDLLYGRLVLRVIRRKVAETTLLGELVELSLRDATSLEGGDLLRLGVRIGLRLGRIATERDEENNPEKDGDVQHPVNQELAQDDREPRYLIETKTARDYSTQATGSGR